MDVKTIQTSSRKHTRNKSYQFWQYDNHAEEIYIHLCGQS
jgi:hypothetical protein